jgi:hypothetical protein
MCICICGFMAGLAAMLVHLALNPLHWLVSPCDGEGGHFYNIRKLLLAWRAKDGDNYTVPQGGNNPLKPTIQCWRNLVARALEAYGKPPFAVAYAGAAQAPAAPAAG